MTEYENKLFKRFKIDDVYHNRIIYRFVMKSGDVFIVTYNGEGESEINPFTGEYEDYYGFVFQILKVEKNFTQDYCDNALIEISRLNFPTVIEKIQYI